MPPPARDELSVYVLNVRQADTQVVRTPEGRPVPDALILLEIEPEDPNEIDDYMIQIRSNPAGKYDFPFVPRGEIWISAELGEDAWSDDYEVELLEGQTEYQTDIELELD